MPRGAVARYTRDIDHDQNASVSLFRPCPQIRWSNQESGRSSPAPLTDTCPLLYSPIFTRFNQWACWKLHKKYKQKEKGFNHRQQPAQEKPSTEHREACPLSNVEPTGPDICGNTSMHASNILQYLFLTLSWMDRFPAIHAAGSNGALSCWRAFGHVPMTRP